jgi:predicted RNA-binding Zn ribbon-like protein
VVTQTPENIKLRGGRLCLHFANTVDWADSGEQMPETDALSVPNALERWATRLGDPAALTFPADLSRVTTRAETSEERRTAAGSPAAATPGGSAAPDDSPGASAPAAATPAGSPAAATPAGSPAAATPGGSEARDSSAAAGSPGLIAARAFRDALYSLFAAISDGDPVPPDALSLLHAIHADGVAAGRLEPRGDAFALVWPPDEPRRVLFAVAADAVALLADPGQLGRVHRCPGRNCGWLFLDTSGRRRWCSMDTCGSRAKMRAMYARRRSVS